MKNPVSIAYSSNIWWKGFVASFKPGSEKRVMRGQNRDNIHGIRTSIVKWHEMNVSAKEIKNIINDE